MTAYGGKGSALHMEPLRVRFSKKLRKGPRPGSSVLDDRIVELRKLLRTERTIAEIAAIFGVDPQTARSFIKRRNLCDMAARSHFISRQRSIRKLEGTAP